MLSAHEISVGYQRGRPVVNDWTFEIAPGEVVGLAGPSGCGKSTVAKVLSLLLAPQRGRVLLDEEHITRFRHAALRRHRTAIGVVFQEPRAAVDPRFTLRKVIAEPFFGADGDTRVRELAETVGLTDELLERRPHQVSDGQLQRACLARALALRPRYLVCDEMTSMLDASTTAALVHKVNETTRDGTGVLTISHDETLLSHWADRVVHMS